MFQQELNRILELVSAPIDFQMTIRVKERKCGTFGGLNLCLSNKETNKLLNKNVQEEAIKSYISNTERKVKG